MKRPSKFWKQDEITLLCEMIEKGHTWHDVAQRIGRDAASCSSKWRRLHPSKACPETARRYPHVVWTPAQENQLRKLRAQGMTYAEVSKAIGHSVTACQTRCYQLGIGKKLSTDRRKWTPEEDQRLIDLLCEGRTMPEIAQLFECDLARVRNRVNRLKSQNRVPDLSDVRAMAASQNRTWAPEEIGALVSMRIAGSHFDFICEMLERLFGTTHDLAAVKARWYYELERDPTVQARYEVTAEDRKALQTFTDQIDDTIKSFVTQLRTRMENAARDRFSPGSARCTRAFAIVAEKLSPCLAALSHPSQEEAA